MARVGDLLPVFMTSYANRTARCRPGKTGRHYADPGAAATTRRWTMGRGVAMMRR